MGKAKYGNWQEQEANGEEKTAKTRITYAKKQHFKKWYRPQLFLVI